MRLTEKASSREDAFLEKPEKTSRASQARIRWPTQRNRGARNDKVAVDRLTGEPNPTEALVTKDLFLNVANSSGSARNKWLI